MVMSMFPPGTESFALSFMNSARTCKSLSDIQESGKQLSPETCVVDSIERPETAWACVSRACIEQRLPCSLAHSPLVVRPLSPKVWSCERPCKMSSNCSPHSRVRFAARALISFSGTCMLTGTLPSCFFFSSGARPSSGTRIRPNDAATRRIVASSASGAELAVPTRSCVGWARGASPPAIAPTAAGEARSTRAPAAAAETVRCLLLIGARGAMATALH
mmetsp:Transcript_56912/g.112094  ORF Transcript_56912/g.112094 Transcript_56912/m.112094 type:complete len:219 (+) Transcript_56912:304-960(+)